MLEIRNISKTYRAKSGVSVKALDGVSLTFAETGMVFLLGKSGSGKSTLLNVIGGLDTYDEGEIIIKGRSSRKFRGSDFDAYRNTFIGFIFQEYNILDEFSVGANIGLALELQGKKATSEAINAILTQVDLLDFASRKPNELSGGQKQRIAIARALIKDPQIIMADEPTGALDSATGKQVLETLKKLSETKLVLVVSHDREFAEQYGDRIIELSDGRVISDMSSERADSAQEELCEEVDEPQEEAPAGITIVDGSVIHISRGYTLTLEDMDMINAYLRKGDSDIVLSKDEAINEDVRAKKGIRRTTKKAEKTKRRLFGRKPTGEVKVKTYNPAETRFIKSRLPLKNAVKIGTASMKAKPIRLIFTIFLSFIAFTMFGLADTMAAYNQYTAMADSLRDSDMQNIAFSLYLRETYMYRRDGEWETDISYRSYQDTMTEADLEELGAATGLSFYGVYNGTSNAWDGISLSSILLNRSALDNDKGLSFFDSARIGGIVELSEADATTMGYTIKGHFPKKENEIVITEYTFQMLQLAGVRFGDGTEISAGDLNTIEGDPKSILGKQLTLLRRAFTIVGVLDTGFDFDNPKYEVFHWDYNGVVKDNDMYSLQSSLESELRYGYHTLALVYPGVIGTMPKPEGGYREYGASFWGNRSAYLITAKNQDYAVRTHQYSRFVGNEESSQFAIHWLTEGKNSLGAYEIVVPTNFFEETYAREMGYDIDTKRLPDILKGFYEEGTYTMREWLDISSYDTYVAHCKQEKKLSYEEYQEVITDFYNDFYDLDFSPEFWALLSYQKGSILDCYVNMNMDEYALNRVVTKYLLDNWDTVLNEAKDSSQGFGEYLAQNGYDDLSMPEGLTEDEQKAILLCAATRYMRENNYYCLFGSTITVEHMAKLEMEACQQKEAERLNQIYGLSLSHEAWEWLRNIYSSSYLQGNIGDMRIYDYVRERELLEWVVMLDVNTIIEEANNKGSAFSVFLQEMGFDVEGTISNSTEEGQKGVWSAYALHYLERCYYNETPAFGLDVRTYIDEKCVEYILAGAKNVSLPKQNIGFYVYGGDGTSTEEVDQSVAYTIVGVFAPENDRQRDCVLSEELYRAALASQDNNDYRTTYGKHVSGKYVLAIAVLPHDDRAALEAVTALHHRAEGEYEFRMNNNVASVIDDWGEMILMFNQIFLYVGIGFAVFAALMMLNFISASVTLKKKEIGILRALGARSSDVFSIFFSEAFVIALINFALAVCAVFAASYFINNAVRVELGFPITLLHAGIRQIALVFGVSVGVAFIGSFLPVNQIARKNPIDAMRDR